MTNVLGCFGVIGLGLEKARSWKSQKKVILRPSGKKEGWRYQRGYQSTIGCEIPYLLVADKELNTGL